MNELILIVDDEVPTLKLLGLALEHEGYRISAGQDARQALARIDSTMPDLVILDVMMPGITGMELCRQLRTRRDTANLPIILLSAKGEVDDRIEGLKAGADEYLVKPIDMAELVARVSGLLERTRRLRAEGARAAKTISFIGAKGGVGTTTVVINVGVALAMASAEVLAVELRGDVGGFPRLLGVKAPRGLADLARADPRSLTPQEVGRNVFRHASGLQALCAPDQFSTESLGEPQAEAILSGLASRTDYLLVDLPSTPTPSLSAAIPRSQVVVLIVEPLPECMERAAPMATFLQSVATASAVRQVLIVTRAHVAAPLTASEVGERLGWPVVGAIPPAPDETTRAATLGRPILQTAPDGMVAEALRGLAGSLR